MSTPKFDLTATGFDDDVTHVRAIVELKPTDAAVPIRLADAIGTIASFPDDPEERLRVEAFLAHQPEILEAIFEAIPALWVIFGQLSLKLELMQDPEVSESAETLYAVIPSTVEGDEAVRLLDQFDEFWLEHRVPNLCFTL